jgi:hypothetical protein
VEEAALATTLSSQGLRVSGVGAPDAADSETRLFVATTPDGVCEAIKRLNDRRSALARWVARGNTCLLAPGPGTFGGLSIESGANGACVFADKSREGRLGLNSGDLDAVQAAGNVGRIRRAPGAGWIQHFVAFRHDEQDEYNGFMIHESVGSILLERKTGKGRVLLTSLDLGRAGTQGMGTVWASIASHTGVKQAPPPDRAESVIVAVRTVPLPMDGDIRKWTNEEPDAHVAPWSRAVPVIVDDRHMAASEKSGAPAKPTGRHGAICYALYDDRNLYIGAKLLFDRFDFEGVEIYRHERDSIEIRVRDTYLLVSIGREGNPFVRAVNIPEEAVGRIHATVRRFEDASECPDSGGLVVDRSIPLKSVFFEVRIPFDALPYDFSSPPDTTYECGLAFNARLDGVPSRLQCTYPAGMKWNDPGTFARLVFK